ncbi:MAG: glycosyltransferase [Firmicutes bacterium]|nr:glycosyltransferase [Bacillota bacterium]
MRFSVLISIYGKEKVDHFKVAMDSILSNTVLPDQIVLVVDGPIPPELEQAVRTYSEKCGPSLEVVRLSENMGLGMALNAGLERCSCEFVARMDSDDCCLPDRFEKQVRYICGHPETDLLGGQIIEYDSELRTQLDVRRVPLSMEDISKRMLTRSGVNHVTVMYRKSAVIKAGGYQHCPHFEDYWLWFRMLGDGCVFANLDDILVKVRTGDGMYRRRGGIGYNSDIISFQKKIYGRGYISRLRFLENIAIRVGVASMPNSLRGWVYRRFLRKGN